MNNTIDAVQAAKPKKIGRMGDVFFIYNIPEEKALVQVDSLCRGLRYANPNVLDNIVKFISFDEGRGLEIEKDADFRGSSYFSVFLDSEKFKEWYDLNMQTSKFRKGEQCSLCNTGIEEIGNFALSGGSAYHRKNCFGSELNSRWMYYCGHYTSMRYQMKIIREFDKDNLFFEQLNTKFALLEIKERIGSAYENYYEPFVIHSDEGMPEEKALEAMKDEINDARRDFSYVTEKFLDFKKYGLTEARAQELLSREKFDKRINDLFEEGRELSGININEITEFRQIRSQCETLFKAYTKYWNNKK